jgi:hypothetical protein
VPIGTKFRHVAYLRHAKLFMIIFYKALAPNGAVYWFVILNAVKYLFAAMHLADGIAFAFAGKRLLAEKVYFTVIYILDLLENSL